MTYRYFIKLSYQGSKYHGWQIQPNATTVQEILNRDLSLLLSEEIKLTGCGRTDTGVHAKVFYAHFDTAKENLETDSDFVYKINGKLPSDISIHEILKVKPEAHARFDAISRTYEYHIQRTKEIFHRELAHFIYGDMDIDAIKSAAAVLKEYTDFTSFSKVDTDVKTNDCKIYHATWEASDQKLVFRISADRFLRNMVRAIVGTLLEVGFGKINLAEFRQIIESRNRSNAGTSAPAKGLFLTDVEYPPELFLIGPDQS
ncbi:tRNA pseudouridine(38-40) synthase TruA [Bacteroidota bacterium]